MRITVDEFLTFLQKCSQEGLGSFQEVLLPVQSGDDSKSHYYFTRLDGPKTYFLDGHRAIDPLKVLFYNVRETVYPIATKTGKRLIAGVKACDLKGLQVLDQALINNDFVDPAYKIWRDNTTIISTDCSSIGQACHCSLVGGKPYPEIDFDVNLSRVDDFYFVRAGSEKGQQLLDLIRQNCPTQLASEDDYAAVKLQRQRMLERVELFNKDYKRSSNYSRLRAYQSVPWKHESRECVGCGACTNICPTCYCLILNDETDNQQFTKVRSYDSCQWNGYARVAGGATPRPHIHERFRNRYLCKLVYMQQNFGQFGCTGCGRCTEACPGRIDFRAVVHNLLEQPWISPQPDPPVSPKVRGEV
ncbi:4Fe-4S dicluster domain-containing protein [candidate division KSB1 bacterium]|nr:4Fe-4S dicluster domain-containing protein [candidate division KSB1 bacterium]